MDPTRDIYGVTRWPGFDLRAVWLPLFGFQFQTCLHKRCHCAISAMPGSVVQSSVEQDKEQGSNLSEYRIGATAEERGGLCCPELFIIHAMRARGPGSAGLSSSLPA